METLQSETFTKIPDVGHMNNRSRLFDLFVPESEMTVRSSRTSEAEFGARIERSVESIVVEASPATQEKERIASPTRTSSTRALHHDNVSCNRTVSSSPPEECAARSNQSSMHFHHFELQYP